MSPSGRWQNAAAQLVECGKEDGVERREVGERSKGSIRGPTPEPCPRGKTFGRRDESERVVSKAKAQGCGQEDQEKPCACCEAKTRPPKSVYNASQGLESNSCEGTDLAGKALRHSQEESMWAVADYRLNHSSFGAYPPLGPPLMDANDRVPWSALGTEPPLRHREGHSAQFKLIYSSLAKFGLVAVSSGEGIRAQVPGPEPRVEVGLLLGRVLSSRQMEQTSPRSHAGGAYGIRIANPPLVNSQDTPKVLPHSAHRAR